jgi:hypothetical protein
MRKVYKINGKTEVHEVFTSPSGKTIYKVTFSKGNLDPKNRVPAKYATESPVIQAVIENSPKFNHTIFLDKVYEDEDPVVEAPVVAAPRKPKIKMGAAKTPSVRVMEEVKTIADAVTVLTSEGATAVEIDGTIDNAIKLAKEYGIQFPNLKGE